MAPLQLQFLQQPGPQPPRQQGRDYKQMTSIYPEAEAEHKLGIHRDVGGGHISRILLSHLQPGKLFSLGWKGFTHDLHIWIWICGVWSPPPPPRWLDCPPPPHTPPPIFRFGGCRLLPLSSQQALKASPFTGGIINIICRYGNLHFSNLSLVTFYVVKFKIGSKGVGNHPKLIYQN